jgi:large subunit ribosomal protein L25
MAGERIKLQVTEREHLGSRESRRLRRQGLIPGVLYGREAPHPIAVPERDLRRVLTGSAGLHAILDVVLEGKNAAHAVILKEYQLDPVRGGVTHIDFQEVRLDVAIQSTVAVELVGGDDAPGVREGGVLSQVTREITIESLPMEIPEHLTVDVSALNIGDSVRAGEVTLPEGVTLVDDPEETVLATVTVPTQVVEPEEMLEGAEAEMVDRPEGEQAPQGGSESQPDPGASAAGGEGTVPG